VIIEKKIAFGDISKNNIFKKGPIKFLKVNFSKTKAQIMELH